MQSGKRILIYRLGSLGDPIAVLPLFNKIADTFPGADITLLKKKKCILSITVDEVHDAVMETLNLRLNTPD